MFFLTHIKLPIVLDERLNDICLKNKKNKSETIKEPETGLFVIDK